MKMVVRSVFLAIGRLLEQFSDRGFAVTELFVDKLAVAIVFVAVGYWLSKRLDRSRAEQAWKTELGKKRIEIGLEIISHCALLLRYRSALLVDLFLLPVQQASMTELKSWKEYTEGVAALDTYSRQATALFVGPVVITLRHLQAFLAARTQKDVLMDKEALPLRDLMEFSGTFHRFLDKLQAAIQGELNAPFWLPSRKSYWRQWRVRTFAEHQPPRSS